eukprot:TRINITY_DN30152_c0_g1_i3.p1 TRINITY_DN30152_c0_g1~~TRINITY_DN30152_c0_g1_i3.p1  ORF type:complete len:224 (-),score=41.97 TRINITY_DN30152_c0_g1_i3:114-785(-)
MAPAALNGRDESPAQKAFRKRRLVQGILCVLCTLIGALYPTLLDWSKTAYRKEIFPDGSQKEYRTYPFSPVSVVFINNLVQLIVAVVGVSIKEGPSAFRVSTSLALSMLPLGCVYGLGELMTLRSVQKGSGPVYVVIANMKLVIAALMSRAFFGPRWSLPWLHWGELVLISMAAAMYTLAEAGQSGTDWNWEGAWMALAKSSLVSMTSVFCEHIYKSNKFIVV